MYLTPLIQINKGQIKRMKEQRGANTCSLLEILNDEKRSFLKQNERLIFTLKLHSEMLVHPGCSPFLFQISGITF